MKRILWFLIIVAIVLNIIYFIYDSSLFSKSYIIFDKKNIWELDGTDVKKVSENKIKKLNNSNAKLYNEDENDGFLYSVEGIRFYNSNYEKMNHLNSVIVVGDKTIKNYTYLLTDDMEESDIKQISDYLKSQKIDFNKSEVRVNKINLNNDKTIYDIQSLSPQITGKGRYSAILMSDNNEITPIYENYSPKSRTSSLARVIDIDNDNIEELVLLSDIYNSGNQECYSLYQYKNGEYKPVINCEEE